MEAISLQPISKEQIKRLQALGAGAGLKEGCAEDNYHAVIFRFTGKSSTKDLTGAEFRLVETELLRLMRLGSRKIKAKPKTPQPDTNHRPGMMTKEQQGMAWRYVYRLIELDDTPGRATAGERMTGAIKKILDLDVTLRDPFLWISQEDGSTLITNLRRYVVSAERKHGRAGVR